jgi:hypothetical protein
MTGEQNSLFEIAVRPLAEDAGPFHRPPNSIQDQN